MIGGVAVCAFVLLKTEYTLVHKISNMENLAKQFRLPVLVSPSPATYRKFVQLEVLSRCQPNPVLHCATCLYKLGFGYDRITRHLKLGPSGKHRVAEWIKKRRRRNGLCKPLLARRTVRTHEPNIRTPKEPKPKQPYIPKYTPEERLAKSIQQKTQFKAKARLRSYFSQWLNHGLYPRLMATVVGCDLIQLHHWIEAQFKGKMSWDNHGSMWHIDHIIPCKAFDLTKREDVQRCFHFSNLRPLGAKANMTKRAKVIPTQPELVLNFQKPRSVKGGSPGYRATA